MEDSPVKAPKQGSGLWCDYCGFEVGAGEVADGVEGTPIGFDDDFDFTCEMAKGNGCAQVPRNAAKFGQNIFGKVSEILGQLGFGGASAPAAQNRSRCWC